MNKFVGVLFLILFILTGCVERTPLQPLMSIGPGGGVDASDWEEYGAVYLYDELRITTDFGREDRRFSTWYTVNQAIRILNQAGMKYGTVDVKRYDGSLKEFEIVLRQNDGSELRVDTPELKEQYLDTGKVVVPRVEPGSEIVLKLSFHDNEPMVHHDHVVVRNIPVLKSRFTFLSSADMKYKRKSYSIADPFQEAASGSLRGFTVDTENVRPIRDQEDHKFDFLLDWLDFSNLQRTMVQLESFWIPGYHYKAQDWEKISENFIRYYHSPSIFSAMGRLEKITNDVTKWKSNDFAKADAILQYVQDNITIRKKHGASRVDIGSVLRNKAGTTIEISVLLSEMFKLAELQTRQYVTRFPEQGGFDPEIPSWYQLYLPLISVNTGDQELIAFPYRRWFKLGEYPPQLDGLHALELGSGKTAPLPPSVFEEASLQSLVELSLTAPDDNEHSWEYMLGSHFEPSYRSYFDGSSSYHDERIGKKILAKYDDQHRLEDIDVEPIRRGDQVTMNFTFKNDNLSVDHGTGKALSLKPFFRKYFTAFMDSSDTRFKNDLQMMIEEEVDLQDMDKNTQVSFTCENLDNVLFRSECSREEFTSGMTVGRKLTIKEVELSYEDFKGLLPDIRKLNRIGESYVNYSD